MKIAQTSTNSVALVYSYKFWNSWEVHKDVLRLRGGLQQQVGVGQELGQQGHPGHQECSYDLELTH